MWSLRIYFSDNSYMSSSEQSRKLQNTVVIKLSITTESQDSPRLIALSYLTKHQKILHPSHELKTVETDLVEKASGF